MESTLYRVIRKADLIWKKKTKNIVHGVTAMQETFNHGAKKQFGKQQYGENAYV